MKTNVMIRFLCGLLCLMMLIGVFPAASFAEGEDGETVANDLPDFDAQFDADAVSVDSAASLEAALSAEAGVIRSKRTRSRVTRTSRAIFSSSASARTERSVRSPCG